MNEPPQHGLLYRRAVLPVFALLRMGATPEKLAWSIAIGVVVGINPLLGSTTILCLVVASTFRLNIAASQLANHAIYPLEILLLVPFIRAGSYLFHTAPLPLSLTLLLHEARTHPLSLTRQLWLWESHALVVWAVFALLFAPIVATILIPLLRKILKRIERREYPVVLPN